MLLLEREARKEAIERKGKNYRFWLFRRKLYHIVVVYALIIGLIGAIVFLWTNYILKYDWLSIDTVTLNSNGIFNAEQAFAVMGSEIIRWQGQMESVGHRLSHRKHCADRFLCGGVRMDPLLFCKISDRAESGFRI